MLLLHHLHHGYRYSHLRTTSSSLFVVLNAPVLRLQEPMTRESEEKNNNRKSVDDEEGEVENESG